jgi:UDP-glucose 6-dehydrogenase
MKVTFLNQLVDAMGDEVEHGINPLQVLRSLSDEPRLGSSHWRVPGPDGKKGFGGACFPKDISALVNYTNKMSLMEEVLSLNNDMRSEYDLDEREKVANVTFKADDVNIITEEDVLDTTGQIELDMFDEDAA